MLSSDHQHDDIRTHLDAASAVRRPVSFPGQCTTTGRLLRSVLRWSWVATSIVALVFAMIVFDRGENRDIDIVLAWVMMTLSFPASVICAMLYGALFFMLESVFAIQVGSGRGEMVATWVGLFAAGFVQWFYLVPYLWRKCQRLRLTRKRSLGSN